MHPDIPDNLKVGAGIRHEDVEKLKAMSQKASHIEPLIDSDEALGYEELAKIAYSAYGDSTGGKNYQGLPMPRFDELTDSIRNAWIAAVKAVVNAL